MKRELNIRHVWLRDGEKIDRDGNKYGEPRRSRIASFWMEGPAAAYQTWAQMIYKFLTAEQEYESTQSEETLKRWSIPTLVGPICRASMEQRKSELLEQRAEDVPKRSVPDGVEFLIATVDVQGGKSRRFVVQVTGYGMQGRDGWSIATTSANHYGQTSTVNVTPLIRPVTRKTGIYFCPTCSKSHGPYQVTLQNACGSWRWLSIQAARMVSPITPISSGVNVDGMDWVKGFPL